MVSSTELSSRSVLGPLPRPSVQDEYVCWSRIQAEAGQQLDAIMRRKEIERQAGDGCFLWGVGNPPSRMAHVLARAGVPVRAVFSVMKSRPKPIDVAPARTLVWRRYIDLEGAERLLPPNVLVTSRGDSAKGAKRAHYALMCQSAESLAIRHGEQFDPAAFRNVGEAGGPVGASQVTALLRRVADDACPSSYEANFVAQLVGSYWVRLTDPIELDASRLNWLACAIQADTQGWLKTVSMVREGPRSDYGGERGSLL
jgi:hypothetical protein